MFPRLFCSYSPVAFFPHACRHNPISPCLPIGQQKNFAVVEFFLTGLSAFDYFADVELSINALLLWFDLLGLTQ